MSASRYINKIRTRVESNEQKVQQPGRVVNSLPLLSANGCSANYGQINYVIPCPCNSNLPMPPLFPILFNSNTGARIMPTAIIGGINYFVITTSESVVFQNSFNPRVVCVGAGGNGIGGNTVSDSQYSGGSGSIVSSTSILNNTVYSISVGSNVSFGSIVANVGISSQQAIPISFTSAVDGSGRGVWNNGLDATGAGGLRGYANMFIYTSGSSGVGYGAGGGGGVNFIFAYQGSGGNGGFDPNVYFRVTGLDNGMPQSTVTNSGSPGVVILAI